MPKTLEADYDSHCKRWYVVIIRTSLFINCWTGLGHKTEKGPLDLLGHSLSRLLKWKKKVTVNYFYDILLLLYFVL